MDNETRDKLLKLLKNKKITEDTRAVIRAIIIQSEDSGVAVPIGGLAFIRGNGVQTTFDLVTLPIAERSYDFLITSPMDTFIKSHSEFVFVGETDFKIVITFETAPANDLLIYVNYLMGYGNRPPA